MVKTKATKDIEIEITPEMIEVGAKLLGDYDPADSWATRCDLIKEIYLSMADFTHRENPSG